MIIAALIPRLRSAVVPLQHLILQSKMTRTLLPTAINPIRCAGGGGGRANCARDTEPRCAPKKDICGDEKPKKDKKKKKEFVSMWENPECCVEICVDLPPRYDDLYYRPSDKLRRKYTRTWVECPKYHVARKKICCLNNILPPEFNRRPRKRRSGKGKKDECDPHPTDLMPCRKAKAKSKCPKITMPGCRGVRDPPECEEARLKDDCKKICTPYPSFSECRKPRPRPERKVECTCWTLPSLCELGEYLRKRGQKFSR